MKNDQVLVSIIVPIYNVGQYLEKCILSIVNQTHSLLQILLIDDGSTDESSKICDDFAQKDPRIQVLHKANAGVSCAKNDGLKMATGAYVCFIDGDDWVEPNYVEYLLNLVIKYAAEIGYSRNYFSNYAEKQIKCDNIFFESGEDAAVNILCYKINIGVWNKIFSLDFLKRNNIYFNPKQFMGEGFYFNVLAFLQATKVAVGLRRIYYYRRDNEKSATTKFSEQKWINALESLQDIKQYLLSISASERIKRAWLFANWRTNSDALDLIILSKNTKKCSELFSRTKKLVKHDALTSFKTETSKKERIRSLCFKINIHIIPLIMTWRKIIFKVRVKN